MKRSCKSCEYWVKEDIDSGHVCCNPASSHVADWTEETDCCFEYERKEVMSRKEIAGLMLDCMAEMKRLILKLEEGEDA